MVNLFGHKNRYILASMLLLLVTCSSITSIVLHSYLMLLLTTAWYAIVLYAVASNLTGYLEMLRYIQVPIGTKLYPNSTWPRYGFLGVVEHDKKRVTNTLVEMSRIAHL